MRYFDRDPRIFMTNLIGIDYYNKILPSSLCNVFTKVVCDLMVNLLLNNNTQASSLCRNFAEFNWKIFFSFWVTKPLRTISAMEKPMENNALSSLHKLWRNRLVSVRAGGEGALYPPLQPAGSVTIYAKTTLHCSLDSSMISTHDLQGAVLKESDSPPPPPSSKSSGGK